MPTPPLPASPVGGPPPAPPLPFAPAAHPRAAAAAIRVPALGKSTAQAEVLQCEAPRAGRGVAERVQAVRIGADVEQPEERRVRAAAARDGRAIALDYDAAGDRWQPIRPVPRPAILSEYL